MPKFENLCKSRAQNINKHIFGMPIKTEQINMGNTATVSATQLFNQENKTTAYFPIFFSVLASYIFWSSNRIPNQKKVLIF